MKRMIVITLLLVFSFCLLTAQAETEAAQPSIVLDGVPTILFPEPIMHDSELMVPIRMMTEAMGVEISWESETKTIRGSRGENNFTVGLDNQLGTINGQAVILSCPILMINQQSYVPLEFICDAMGAEFEKDGATINIYDRLDAPQTVIFTIAKQPALRYQDIPEAGQGEYLSLYLDNIEVADTVTLQTNLDNKADFYPCATGKHLLMPVSCTQSPGSYYLQIKVQRDGFTYLWAQDIIRILPRSFPEQHLKVSAQTAAKRGEDLWAQDQPFWDRGLANSANHAQWTGTFIRPATGRISTEFGSVRYVNQEKPSRHSGLDIAVPAGTPVLASQDGVVTLAMPLNVTGNTVFVDHGCQLFSMYYHLIRIAVEEGQTVKTGDLIGEVGSTGFSTGPHLHWAIQLSGVYVNPAQFLNIETSPR